jgi:transposase-like protein
MSTHAPTSRYKNHRFPVEIFRHGVWLYYRFCLSYRGVEDLLFTRGVIVTYEAVRKWCVKFGQSYANQLRRRRRQPGYLNNRADNSRQPIHQRERRMQGFKPSGHARRFLAAYGPVAQHFRPRLRRLSAPDYRQEMRKRFASWREITSLPTAA